VAPLEVVCGRRIAEAPVGAGFALAGAVLAFALISSRDSRAQAEHRQRQVRHPRLERMFIAGLVLFSISSLAGGLAQSEAWLIVARAAQGLGAAIVSPAALAIMT